MSEFRFLVFFLQSEKLMYCYILITNILCWNILLQDFQNRAAVRELNVIPPLLGLLESEYPVIQSLALQTLEVISKDRETRILLEEYKGLDCLLNILENNVRFTCLKIFFVLGADVCMTNEK